MFNHRVGAQLMQFRAIDMYKKCFNYKPSIKSGQKLLGYFQNPELCLNLLLHNSED